MLAFKWNSYLVAIATLLVALTSEAGTFDLFLEVNNGDTKGAKMVKFPDAPTRQRRGQKPAMSDSLRITAKANLQFPAVEVVRFRFVEPLKIRIASYRTKNLSLPFIDVLLSRSEITALQKLDSLRPGDMLVNDEEYIVDRFLELLDRYGPTFFIKDPAVPHIKQFNGLKFSVNIHEILDNIPALTPVSAMLTSVEEDEPGQIVLDSRSTPIDLVKTNGFFACPADDKRIQKLLVANRQIWEANALFHRQQANSKKSEGDNLEMPGPSAKIIDLGACHHAIRSLNQQRKSETDK